MCIFSCFMFHDSFYLWYPIIYLVYFSTRFCTRLPSVVGLLHLHTLIYIHRIPYEEYLLIKFYGEQYIEYQNKTVIGIPFIQGSRPRSMNAGANSSGNPSATELHGLVSSDNDE